MYVKELRNELLDEHEDMFMAYSQTYEFVEGNIVVDYESTNRFRQQIQSNQIREALMKGYVEMSQLNLSICRECLHAEYEADYMMERLVNGG